MGKTTLAILPRRPEPSRRTFAVRRWRRGILLAPVWVDGRLLGEPGQVVRYRARGERLDVVVGVYRLARDLPPDRIVCYHPVYTPSRVYLHLTRRRPENEEAPGDKCLLAVGTAREFAAHELREELMLLACRYAEAYEGRGVSRYPRTRMLIREYLRAHPRGRFRDWMEWKSVQLKYHYRPDGDVAKPLSAVQACERFLAVRPRNAYKAEIKLHMARLYHAAYLCVIREEHTRGLTRIHAERFLRRSEYLYRGLTQNPDLRIRHTARLALRDPTKPPLRFGEGVGGRG
jgi:hypothetical protein